MPKPTLSANRNPGYSWQRKQEKAAEAFNQAKEIAIAKIIKENFGEDPDEFKDPKRRWGKGALVVGVLVVLEHVQLELKRTKEVTAKAIIVEQDKIAKLTSKDRPPLSDQQKKDLADAMKKRNEL